MGQVLFDGNISFRGGQNAGTLPDRIREDQYAAGINVSTRDGGLGPRSGFVQEEFTFITEGGVTLPDGNVKSYQAIFRGGKFQGASKYSTDIGTFVIAVISGVIFKIDPSCRTIDVIEIQPQRSTVTQTIEAFEPATQRINQYCRRVNFAEAGRFLVIFDYPDNPVIIDGGEARRANSDATDIDGNPCPEVPASVIGAFNQNRLFVSNAVHEFTGGDPVGSLASLDAPVTFKEIFIQAAPFLGQAFSLGTTNTNNPITAMGFIQVVDTSTGIGPLFVATKDSVYTFRTDLPRAQWEQTRFGSLLLFNAGIAGQRAFAHTNSDLLFMSGDGRIRSLSMARSEQAQWANTPIDREVRNWVKFDDRSLIPLTVVESFNNKVFFTVDPFRTEAQDLSDKPISDYAFGGMIVLELDNTSGLTEGGQPVWAGLWSGVYPMDLIKIDDDLFIFSKDPNSKNAIYRLDESVGYDVVDSKVKQVTSRIYTRQYTFGNLFKLKEERSVSPTLTQLEGDVCVRVDRKVESASKWLKWRDFTHKAPTESCAPDTCEELPVLIPHNLRELNLGSPEESEECNPVTDELLDFFRKMQCRVTINAKGWRLEDFQVQAEEQEEDNLQTETCETRCVELEKDCEDINDWMLYRTPFDVFGQPEDLCQ